MNTKNNADMDSITNKLLPLQATTSRLQEKPLRARDPSVATPPDSKLAAADKSLKILSLVTDKTVQMLLKKLCPKALRAVKTPAEACACLGLTNAPDAQPLLTNFDLVLIDFPKSTRARLAIAKKIRAREKQIGGHLPLIALTEDLFRTDQKEYLAVGIDALVSKPLSYAFCQQIIHTFTNKKLTPVTVITPTTAPEAATPVFNKERFLEEYMGGDHALALEFAALFLNRSSQPITKNYKQHLAELQTALATQDNELLQNKAHLLKGQLAFFSPSAQAIARHLEKIGQNQLLPLATVEATLKYTELTTQTQQLSQALEDFIKMAEKA
jgi:CheY-like chemotaxis protein